MFEIDPSREDLAEEFRADPFGKHSPELQLLLNRMRKGTARGRYALAVDSDGGYTLVQLSGVRGVAPTRLEEHRFSDPAEAEWVAFGLRWHALTGTRLSIGEGSGDGNP
ncbi:MAG: hypothetical protein O7A04_02090 [Acidobacteria bacterium]|nr:hypothetical protein [Acidobacteriota bacterium]